MTFALFVVKKCFVEWSTNKEPAPENLRKLGKLSSIVIAIMPINFFLLSPSIALRLLRCAYYAPRNLGSSLSRTASPKRFEAKTTRLIAVPGKRTSHGAFWANSAAETESILPHDG